MKFRGIIKLPSHKQFTYIPRYYDKEKEDRCKARVCRTNAEIEEQEHSPSTSLRKGSMRGHYHQKDGSKRVSSVQLIVIIIILLVVAYYLLS